MVYHGFVSIVITSARFVIMIGEGVRRAGGR